MCEMLGDRKGVMSEKGITAGFKSAKKQGCKIVVIDLDERVNAGVQTRREIESLLETLRP